MAHTSNDEATEEEEKNKEEEERKRKQWVMLLCLSLFVCLFPLKNNANSVG